jgi:hypothetical protein
VIRVAVPNQHVLHVVRVEPERAQARQQDGLELLWIAGVDEQNSVGRRERPNNRARAPERVEVIEHACRRDNGIVGSVGAARRAAEELDGLAPLCSSSRTGARDAGRDSRRRLGGRLSGG